ncbi:GNAT family N-acetyltransferase [Paeniglutamicibacter psychrophenolicus]|uniref:GNAT superfamily N-acetyltransferase n=1 Tax=Paeniglutamicibacter psychrophenolicus TaxID=257454 RepID=A0ABS4WHT8_9MICC|nr:GNAT family N-acetyltransferase [Paeniglutamicibacter psychrophenolicus]MBP2375760.1 GNAT superfamily N-acetyltransferase [Paeniglutamicibacter psychrophenolicus]
MSTLEYRPWADGDDLALLEIFGDPASPHAHQDRTMFRKDSDAPFSRALVATDQGIAVAAGVVFASTLHPQRLWLYVEVAREHRRTGVATELVARLRALVPAGQSTELKARYTVTAGTDAAAAAGFCASLGMQQIQVARDVVVEPGGLALPFFDDDGLTLEDIGTGSVELTRLVIEFYNSIHEWDPAHMTLGSAQKMLLDDATGAQGVIVFRDKPKARGGKILSFAVSYTPARADAPADVLLGWNPELGQDDSAEPIRGMLAMLAHQFPVKLEVDGSMVVLSSLIDVLVAAKHATVTATTYIVATA